MKIDDLGTGTSTLPRSSTAMIASILGAYASQAICVMARLGVADALAEGPRPAESIAGQIGADAAALHRLLRAVSDAGIVTELDDGRFGLTPLGELLRTDVPGSLRAWATLIGMPFWHRSWSELYEAIRTGQPQFDRVNGMPFFDYLAENTDAAEIFGAGFAAVYTCRTIIGRFDLSGFDTIVDVGGGPGRVLAEILSAHPRLSGVLFDTPAAVAGAESEFARAGVADRCRVVGGDDLTALPGGGDVYLLSGMIHGSTDDQAIAILRACRSAMAETAHLLIAEIILPAGNRPSVGKLLDLQMLVFTAGGRFRTEPELRSLLERSGFRMVRVLPSSGMVGLAEAVPAAALSEDDHGWPV